MVDTGDLKSPAYGVPVRVRPWVPHTGVRSTDRTGVF